jgi:hypothetical protein
MTRLRAPGLWRGSSEREDGGPQTTDGRKALTLRSDLSGLEENGVSDEAEDATPEIIGV